MSYLLLCHKSSQTLNKIYYVCFLQVRSLGSLAGSLFLGLTWLQLKLDGKKHSHLESQPEKNLLLNSPKLAEFISLQLWDQELQCLAGCCRQSPSATRGCLHFPVLWTLRRAICNMAAFPFSARRGRHQVSKQRESLVLWHHHGSDVPLAVMLHYLEAIHSSHPH